MNAGVAACAIWLLSSSVMQANGMQLRGYEATRFKNKRSKPLKRPLDVRQKVSY